MFIRGKSNRHKPIVSSIKQEVVLQEQPLEPSIAEVALQKVEEILTMVPELDPIVEEKPIAAEEESIFDEAVEFIEAEEPVESADEEAPAEESIPDLLDFEEGE